MSVLPPGKILIFLTLFWVSLSVSAQEKAAVPDQTPVSPLPRGYRGITLGMTPGEVKELLQEDPALNYAGEPALSLLDRPRASLLEVGSSLFLAQGIFQFENDALTSIYLDLDAKTMDWYTMYRRLEAQYGPPVEMNPQKSWWEDEMTRLSLERPLTVKYLDKVSFTAAIEESRIQKAWREEAREIFLEDF